MSKHLFIGGVADGRWIETEHHLSFRVPKHPQAGGETFDSYEKTLFKRDDEKVFIFVLSRSENSIDVLSTLVANYHPGDALSAIPEYHDSSGLFIAIDLEKMIALLKTGRLMKPVKLIVP